MNPVTIATVCMSAEYSTEKNVKKYMRYIDEASEKGANLIVFPEASLQGYLNSLRNVSFECIDYLHGCAECVPDGPSTQRLIDIAMKKKIHIIWGMIEKDLDKTGILYNTAVLVGPDGYIGKYRKVHQPMDEFHVFAPGSEWPVFDTEIGKIGMLICYDKNFPESARELTLGGADILVMPTAWSRHTGNTPETDHHIRRYCLYEQTRALENGVFFISSNQVGVCGDIDYCGYSQIINPDGVVVAGTKCEEGMAVATFEDIKKEIILARTELSGGVWMLKDRKPETYQRLLTKML